MNILIAGAGEVGRHAAEVLGSDGHNVVVIDISADKLAMLEDRLDVRTLRGNCVQADVLLEAGAEKCDLFIAATNIDEMNLLASAVAKGVGVKKCLTRVHHSAFFQGRGLDYAKLLGIDSLICPEYLTARLIAQTLRNPGAIAVADFASGTIDLQELSVDEGAPAVSSALQDLNLPRGVRLAQIRRGEQWVFPRADTVVCSGDVVTLIGEHDTFQKTRKLFTSVKLTRKNVIIMGGSSMGVWLCRALRGREFSIRLFEINPDRAEELADKLEHVTVVRADPTDESVSAEERIGAADAFIALTGADERNILACARAKSLGVGTAIATVKSTAYMHLLTHVGIDAAHSPRVVAADEIRKMLQFGRVRRLASLSHKQADVYEVRPTQAAKVIGMELRNLKLPEQCMIGAIQRDGNAKVPGAEDTIARGDQLLIIGPHGIERQLKKLFVTK